MSIVSMFTSFFLLLVETIHCIRLPLFSSICWTAIAFTNREKQSEMIWRKKNYYCSNLIDYNRVYHACLGRIQTFQ